MRAAVTRSFGETRVEEWPDPKAGPGEAVVRVEACGVCSGEGLPWYVNRKVPAVLGHEVVGTITEVGEGLSDGFVGARVFAHHHVPCGECHFCRRGFVTNCKLFRETALDPGGFAEYMRVPAENFSRDTLKLPQEVPVEEAIFLEPIACSIRALNKLGDRPGDSILLIGLGVMGLLNVLIAGRRGFKTILGSDFIAERREVALRLGAKAVVDPAGQDLRSEVEAATDGRGADAVIVGPGTPAALRAGLDAVAPGGTVVQFTPTPADQNLEVDTHRFYFSELTLTSSYSCGPEDTREALEIISSRDLPLADLVTGRFGLDGVDEAMRRIGEGGGHLKSIILP
ncbi:MAG: alcohol dehydrogenase catalytic domain-containing protein [Planctomycetota bacterium]|nr:alcohol dehydrogenase catalytic domain-containing protein [Planctomycetota bacterium]